MAILNILHSALSLRSALFSVLDFENSAGAKVWKANLCCSLQKPGWVKRQYTWYFATWRWGNLWKSIHIITCRTFASWVRWVEMNQRVGEQELDQEYVSPWEDTGRKANKLGQCLTFRIPSERNTYPLLMPVNLSMIHLSSICCKYLSPQWTRCSYLVLLVNSVVVSPCEVYIYKSVDTAYQRSLSFITCISTHILCLFIMQVQKGKCKLYS